MENFLDGLNKEQREAAEHNEGTLIILAGAGCGKTKVLTSRIANLIKNGVSAYEVLAVTFTNKAAKEMKDRLSVWLGEECVKRMWVGTFHGIAGRILRMDIDKYVSKDGKKYDKSFVIYDDSDMNTIIKNALKTLNLDENIYQVKLVRQEISNAKNKMLSVYDYETQARSFRDQQYAKIYTEYQNQLALNNAVDFDDMLLMACELLRNNPEIREKYFKRFKHILVDEFQDTNLAQYNFIKSIYTNDDPMYQPEKRSLCTVGDIDQSIYSWRGADYRILLNMQSNFPDAKLIKLEQNYRSTGMILNAANAIIQNNNERTEKNLYSNLGKGDLIEIFEAGDEDEEADYIVRNVKNLKRDYKLSEICVLYRRNSQSRKIEDSCIYHSMPYKIVGGQKFYDRKEIKDVVAYLKLIENPADSQSLARIINVPKRSIGETTVAKLREISSQTELPISEVLLEIDKYDEFSASTKTKLKNFYELISDLQIKQKSMSIPEFIKYLLDETEYREYIKEIKDEKVDPQERIENLEEFINVAREFEPTEEGKDNVLGEFLSQVALVSDIDTYEEEDNALTLMTLHSAKGLEFDVVFLAGLDEGIFPHSRATNSQGYHSDAEMEEERRLMYVGVTRARKKLFLTHSETRRIHGQLLFLNPSRFIGEIPSDLKSGCVREERKSSSSERTYGSSFNNAAQKVRTSYATFENGRLAPQTTFGKNFISPQKRGFISKKSDNHAENKQASQEKINKILEDNPIKRKIAEARERASLQTPQPETENVSADFQKGDRVFHSQFGIGYITDVKTVAGMVLYIVDFGKHGQKSFDSQFVNLKKF
ncbi:MAG: UvrD-helicase domain-containing protein [Candidatus Gastranaerophilales bacterium]|nr:UvrD-helicase domain-containing protein [Candidatus Gastranaerophilales bacterium]